MNFQIFHDNHCNLRFTGCRSSWRGCLPGNLSCAHRFRDNHRKLHVTVKLIKRRIRKMLFLNFIVLVSERKLPNGKTDEVCWTVLPSLHVVTRTTQQTALCRWWPFKLCRPFAIFVLVVEKIHFEVWVLNIFQFALHAKAYQKFYPQNGMRVQPFCHLSGDSTKLRTMWLPSMLSLLLLS